MWASKGIRMGGGPVLSVLQLVHMSLRTISVYLCTPRIEDSNTTDIVGFFLVFFLQSCHTSAQTGALILAKEPALSSHLLLDISIN